MGIGESVVYTGCGRPVSCGSTMQSTYPIFDLAKVLIDNPTVSGLDSHTMMLSYSLLLVDRQALSEHTTTSSPTKSLGQALRVSLVKPGAYLSESQQDFCVNIRLSGSPGE